MVIEKWHGPCDYCNGTGEVWENDEDGNETFDYCQECGGTGESA